MVVQRRVGGHAKPGLMELARTEIMQDYRQTIPEDSELNARIKSVDLYPGKGLRLRHNLVAGDRENTRIVVQEDHLVVSELDEGQCLSTHLSECAGIVFSGKRAGKGVVGIAHIDADSELKGLSSKLDRVVKALEGVKVEEGYLDFDCEARSDVVDLFREKLPGFGLLETGDSVCERVLVVNKDGVGRLQRFDEEDVADTVLWSK